MAFEQSCLKPGLQSMTSGKISSGLDLTSKDEALEVIKTFLKKIQVLLQTLVIIVRIDNGTEFKNQVLEEYFDSVGISHQASSIRTPQQNGVVQHKNHTLVEATRTILIFSRAPLIYWLKQLLLRATPKTTPSFIVSLTKHHTSLLTAKNRISPFFMYLGLSAIPRMIVKTLGSLVQKVTLAFSLLILLIPVLIEFTTVRQNSDMCMYALMVSTIEPKNVKKAMTNPARIESMQEELLQFKSLNVYVDDIIFGSTHPRPKAVVSVVLGNKVNAIKASACWVWKPKTKVIDHVSKHNSASITLKKFDHVDAQDEAVNEEMDDSLERAATISTSLDADQDRGNIFKTQSKETPNEPGSQGTSSGGGPRCQETIGDTVAQTKSKRVSKSYNDPLLVGETTPALEIDSLKRRVKKLKMRKRSRTHGLKRLYKFGLSTIVESFEDESLGEEDASKQKRIADIDANKGIYLVNVHNDEDMFGVNDLDGDEVIVESVDIAKEAKEVVDDITLAKALMKIKSAKPKADKAKINADYELAQRLQAEEQEELTDAEKIKLFMQFLEKMRKFFAARRAKEKRNKPPTRAQQRSIMCTYLKNMEGWKLKSLKNKSFANIQEMFDKAMKRVNTFVDYMTELVLDISKKAEAEVTEGSSKRAKEELEQENANKQKMKNDKEFAKLKQCLEIIPDDGDDVTVDATPLSSKSPAIVDYKIHKEGKKSYFQICRADDNS
nr:putative ribonuclease H-like domain-containing protein [Tanacetum cinerariifolium]